MNKIICLTFDDGQIEHLIDVAPLLLKYNFNATFFINGEMSDQSYSCPSGHRIKFMNWFEVKELSKNFEIGNHGYFHRNLARFGITDKDLHYVPEKIGMKCTTFCYPAYHYNINNIKSLKKAGYIFGRAGVDKVSVPPKVYIDGTSGALFDPLYSNHFNIQCLGIFGKGYGFNEFVRDIDKIEKNQCGIFNFHGIGGDRDIDISLNEFKKCIEFLSILDFKVTSISGIYNYLDVKQDQRK